MTILTSIKSTDVCSIPNEQFEKIESLRPWTVAIQRIETRLQEIMEELKRFEPLQEEEKRLRDAIAVIRQFESEAVGIPLSWNDLTYNDAAERAIKELGGGAVAIKDIVAHAKKNGFQSRNGNDPTNDGFRRRMVEDEKRFIMEEDGRFRLLDKTQIVTQCSPTDDHSGSTSPARNPDAVH